MTTEEAFSFSIVLINLALLLACYLIVEDEHPKPAINAFKLGVLANAVSWALFVAPGGTSVELGSLYATAIYMWSMIAFSRRRAGIDGIWPAVLGGIAQCIAYTWFEFFGSVHDNLHTTAIFGALSAVLVCWNFLYRKPRRTASDVYFAACYILFLLSFAGFSLVIWLNPEVHREAIIVQYLIWPALYTSSGIFALSGYMQEAQGRLREQALRDPMTGLLNRRGFKEHFGPMHSHAERQSLPMTLIEADIDHFKEINDRYGHDIGDLVLNALAMLLEAEVRQQDLVARFGGEEFVILLPYTDIATGMEIAERLRHSITEVEVVSPDGPVRFTASFGVATVEGGATFDRLFGLTDTALYVAKEKGRNRVERSVQ